MKLTLSTVAAAVLLTGAASAMTEPAPFFEPRDAALGGNGMTNTGEVSSVPIEDVFEAREQALNSAETVDLSTFEGSGVPEEESMLYP